MNSFQLFEFLVRHVFPAVIVAFFRIFVDLDLCGFGFVSVHRVVLSLGSVDVVYLEEFDFVAYDDHVAFAATASFLLGSGVVDFENADFVEDCDCVVYRYVLFAAASVESVFGHLVMIFLVDVTANEWAYSTGAMMDAMHFDYVVVVCVLVVALVALAFVIYEAVLVVVIEDEMVGK